MGEIEGHRYDETGLFPSAPGAPLGEWRELTRIGSTAAHDGVRWGYALVFVFAEVESVTVPIPSGWLGRPPLADLSELLQMAVRRAPATVEVTPRARLLLAWERHTESEHEQLRAMRASEPDARKLLAAAHWRWARLEHGAAARLASAATRRAPGDAEVWKALLLIEVERRARVARVQALCAEVLARAPGDPEAQAIAGAFASRTDAPLWKTALRRLPAAAAFIVAAGVVGFWGWARWEEQRERERAVARMREQIAKQFDVDRRPEPLAEAEWQAAIGNPHALLTLAEFHEQGLHGLKADPAEAHRLRLEAAEEGHAPAMTLVGRALLLGDGVERNVGEAQTWLERAAEGRSGEAAYLLGEFFFRGLDAPQDYKASYRWYARAFALGHPEARGQLAYHYERGLGTKKNLVSAFALYRVLADRGDGWAANKVGYLLSTGQGVERDEAAAARWYRIGAQKGDATAQMNLAFTLLAERTVERNDAEAMAWLEKAIAQGEPTAGAFYADLQWRGSGVKQDRPAALARVEALAAEGSAPARSLLGKFLVASGPQQDLPRARKLLDEGSAAGSSADQAVHGLLCLEGIGGPRDIESALTDLELASKDGHQSAAIFLAGARMGYGRAGVVPDLAAARQAIERIKEPGKDLVPYVQRLNEGGNVALLLAGKTEAVAAAPGEDAIESGEVLPETRRPLIVSQAPPSYPLAGRVLDLEGEVVVEFIVSPAGRVENAKAVKSTLPLFDVAAISAVQQWRFKPGVKEGRAVPTRMQVPIRFSLNDEPAASVRVDFYQGAGKR